MTLKIDFSKLDKKLVDVKKSFDKQVARTIKETAEQDVKTIVQRTRSKSQDKDGKGFAKYSDSYLEQRRKSGASSRVILTSAGATTTGKARKGRRKALRGNAQGGTMLNSITIVRIENQGQKAVISLARPLELQKMTAHVRGSGNLPVRNPLGFTKAEDKQLTTRAAIQITAAIQKIGRQ